MLLETKGFVASADPRLATLISKGGEAMLRASVAGGYANPLDYIA